MESEANTPCYRELLLNSILNFLRHCIEISSLATILRPIRAVIHFGPWRVIPKYLIQKYRPVVQELSSEKVSLLPLLNISSTVKKIHQDSIAIAGTLPLEFLLRIRKTTDSLRNDHYQLMHLIDENVHELANDPAVKEVLRAYFKCEPELLESTLMITDENPSSIRCQQNTFHFDYAGWESLNVFVYLSDVTLESSYHSVAKGSHRDIRLTDLIRGKITSKDASARFGSSIENVTGPAGTIFFENTEAFHRRKFQGGRRVLLNILYSSHRSLLSHGRTSKKHIQNRTAAYKRSQIGNNINREDV